jgi:hypothetical protein
MAGIAAQFHDRPVELILSPEELGIVRMTLSASDGAAVLSVSAERPDTLDLMRRNIELLERQFRDLGFDSVSFTFGGHAKGGTPDRDRSDGASSPGRPAATDDTQGQETASQAPPPNGGPPPRKSPGRLDLRI